MSRELINELKKLSRILADLVSQQADTNRLLIEMIAEQRPPDDDEEEDMQYDLSGRRIK